MKKRVLAALLCVAMTASLLVGCGGSGSDTEKGSEAKTESEKDTGSETPGSETPDSEKPSTENSGTTEKVELSAKPVLHYTFDSADEGGWKVVVADDAKSNNNAYDVSKVTGSRGIVDGDASKLQVVDGAVGKAVYLDGATGLDLQIKPTNTDAYTISFWTYADRMVNFCPSLQLGSNMAFADGQGGVSWINVTQANWDGTDDFPLIWSRNELFNVDSTNTCWPWMYSFDGVQHVKEWVMVTIVVSGETYTGANGATYVGSQLYINGELKYDSLDNFNNGTYFEYTWDATLAPDIMKPTADQTFESYFGINYWDILYKGCVDDMYVFDSAISADDVAALWKMGDASVVPNYEDTTGALKDNARPLIKGTVLGSALYDQAWWTTWSDIWEVKEGETKTVTFRNYHTNISFANHMNPVVILQNTATGHSGDAANINYAEGYAEYGVVRLDNYGWKGADNTNANLDVLGWKLENNWNFDTFKDDTHNSDVVLTVTNNGSTADVVFTLTTADGSKTYTQSYKNIAVDGPLYFCLTVEKACLDILEVK